MITDEQLNWILNAKPLAQQAEEDPESSLLPHFNQFPSYSSEIIQNIISHRNDHQLFHNLLEQWPKDIDTLINTLQKHISLHSSTQFQIDCINGFALKTFLTYFLISETDTDSDKYEMMVSALIALTIIQNNEKMNTFLCHIIKQHMKMKPEYNAFDIEQISTFLVEISIISEKIYGYIAEYVKLVVLQQIVPEAKLQFFNLLNEIYEHRPNFNIPSKYATEIVCLLINYFYELEPASLKLFENLSQELGHQYGDEVFRSITTSLFNKINQTKFTVDFIKDNFIQIETIKTTDIKQWDKKDKVFKRYSYEALPIPQDSSILIPKEFQNGIKIYVSIFANNASFFDIFMKRVTQQTNLRLEKDYKIIGLVMFIISVANSLPEPFRVQVKKIFPRKTLFDPAFQVLKHKNDWLNTARDEYIQHMILHHLEFYKLLGKLMHFPEIFNETVSRFTIHREMVQNDEKMINILRKALICFYNLDTLDNFNNLIYNIMMICNKNEIASYFYNNKRFMTTLLELLVGFGVNDFILETFKLYLKDKGRIDDDELFETISEIFEANIKDYENEDTIDFATLLIKLAITYMRFYPQKESFVFMLYKQFTTLFNYLKNNEFCKKYFLEILTYIRSTESIAQISPQSSEMLINTSNRIFIEDKSRLFVAFASLMAQKEVLAVDQPIVIKCNSAVRILFEVMKDDSLDFILMLVNHSQRNRLACRTAELDIAILESIKKKSIDVKKGVEILMKISSEKSSASVVYSFLSLLVTPDIDVFMQNANILFTLLQDDKRTPLTYIPVDGQHSITHTVDNIQAGFTFITWIFLDDSAETSFPSILKARDMNGHLFDLFFSGKLPFISWGTNLKAGIEAARQKFQSQAWYFYALTYYIDAESIFVTININGQSMPAIMISTENSVKGKVTFSFAKTRNVHSCPASLGPILLFEPLNEPDIQQIFGTGMENASNYKNRLLYSFTKSNKNITKPSSFVSVLSKNVDTCVFLPMFIACDKTNDIKCFTISLQCLYEIVLSSSQAQKHFANIRGFEMFSIILQNMTNKNWINSVVYMQTYNVLQNLTNEKLKQQMIVSFLLNIDVWLLCNDENDLLSVLKHWQKYLIPPYLLFYPTIFQFKLFLYSLTKTVEKFKEKDLSSHVQIFTDICTNLKFDLDCLKGVVSLLTSPEFKKYQTQLILMTFNGIKKIDKEFFQKDEFLSILRTLFSLKSSIISEYSIFTLFSEDFQLNDDQFLNLLVDVVERDVTEKEFLEILDSSNSYWAVFYLLFRSKKSFQFLSLLLNKKNIKEEVSDLKKLVWICLSVFSENFETSDQMLKILSTTDDNNWIFIFEMIGVVGSAIGINPEYFRSRFIQCLLEEELENGFKNILSFRKLSKKHFFCKTNWDIKSRPENVREFVANLISIKDLTFFKNSQISSDDNLAEEIKKVDVYFMDESTKAISKPEELFKVLEVTSQTNLKFTHIQKFQNLSLSEVIKNSKTVIYENEFNQKMKSVTFIGAPFENFKKFYKISEIEKLTSHGTTIGKPSDFIGDVFVLDEKNKKISVKLYMNDSFISITNDENYFKNFVIKLITVFKVFNDFVTISFKNGAFLKLIVDRQTIEKVTQRIPNLSEKTCEKFIDKIMSKWTSNYLTNCELLWNLRVTQGIVEKPFVNKKGNLTFSTKNKDLLSLTEMLQITNKFKDINEFISIVNSSQIFEYKILSKPLAVKPINHFEGRIKIDPSKSVSIYGYKTINIVTGNRVYMIDFENSLIERSNSFPKRKWDYSISGSQVDFLYDGKLVSRIPYYCASICSSLCTNIDGCFVLIGSKNYVQILSSSGVIMNSISMQGIPDMITMTPHLNFVIVLSKDNDGSSSSFRISSFTIEGSLINSLFINSIVTSLYSFTDWNGRETAAVVTDGNEIILIDALSMEKRTIYISKHRIVSFYYVKKYDCAVIVLATGKVVVIKL